MPLTTKAKSRQRPSEETIKFLTVQEIERLMNSIKSKRDLALIYVAYRHGLRVSEARFLQREDIDFDAEQIYTRRLKGSRSSWQTMDAETVKVLKGYLKTRKDVDPILFRSKKGGPLSRQQLDRLFKSYATKARLPKEKKHFHVLKHSCATHLLELSEDIALVQKWLGHKEIKNTMVYADLIGLTVNNRVKALSGKFPRAI